MKRTETTLKGQCILFLNHITSLFMGVKKINARETKKQILYFCAPNCPNAAVEK